MRIDILDIILFYTNYVGAASGRRTLFVPMQKCTGYMEARIGMQLSPIYDNSMGISPFCSKND